MRTPISLEQKTAAAPFDRPPTDLVLKSSDGVYFHVFSQILVTASQIFDNIITDAQSSSPSSHPSATPNTPVVSLVEHSTVLDALLRIIYPIGNAPHTHILDEIPPLLDAALKYMMAWPTSVLTNELLAFAQDRPLQVWAIGCRFGLEAVARRGAERSLHFKELGTYDDRRVFVPVGEFIMSVNGVSAGDYFRLVEFHREDGKTTIPKQLTLAKTDCGQTTTNMKRLPDSDVNATKPLPSRGSLIDSVFFSTVRYPDLTCRASDGGEYQVHKGVLCMNSPILHALIGKFVDAATPILKFEEVGEVLAPLLRLCYPNTKNILPDNISLTLSLVEAADKYDMSRRVTDLLDDHWTSITSGRPYAAFFAAVQAGHSGLARIAARQTLRLEPTYVPEMEESSAGTYQRLLDYQLRAADAVSAAIHLSDDLWKTSSDGDASDSDSDSEHQSREPCKADRCVSGACWVDERRDGMARELRERPGRKVLSALEYFERSTARSLGVTPWCGRCFGVATDIIRLGVTLPRNISEALDTVSCRSDIRGLNLG